MTREDFAVLEPLVLGWLGGGRLIPLEWDEHPVARALDQSAGIDAIHTLPGGRVRGVALRVQYGQVWASFTIRERRADLAETEAAKRLAAIRERDRGWLYPAVTVQAYLTAPGGDLIYAAGVRTEDLYGYLQSPDARYDIMTNGTDGNRFIVVWVEHLTEAGVRVKEWGITLQRHQRYA